MDWKRTLLICFVILIVGGGVTMLIFSTEPTATQSGASQETAMLVDVTEVEQGTFNPVIRAMGTVEPSQEISLSPRVSGTIIERSQNFTPGGYVQEGETLVQINPEDYENTLQQRRSELQQAQSNLTLEMGRQEAAEREYQIFGDTLSEENRARVLRQPQLRSEQANVESARAAVEQAQLDLQRTTIEAPFDAHILNRNVNVGSQVAPGENLARLVGFDEFWIEATVPVSKLRQLDIPDGEEQGAEVRISNRTAWPEGEYRTGYLYKMLGALEEQTRMARVLISVPDPHLHLNDNVDQPVLMIGSFVEANIEAEELSDVVRLNRDYIRDDNTVWVMADKKLRIRDVNIVFEDAKYAYIESGLDKGDQVVTTNLTTVTDGAPLRLEGSEGEMEQDSMEVDTE